MVYTLPDDIANVLMRIAQTEDRDPEQVLREALRQYEALAVPKTVEDVRRRMYTRARAYWRANEMSERASLTDKELEEQFDFFDADDIPRLKSDGMTRPTTPLMELLGTLDTEETDLSEAVRETMRDFYKGRYGRPD
jgi:hypothetical protein